MNRKFSIILSFICLALFNAGGAVDVSSAIKNNDIQGLLFILKNVGAEKASEKGKNGVYPLHIAAALNKPEIIDILVSFNADVNVKTDNGFTPLHWAASRDSVEALRVLLNAGADPDTATPSGITPLHWAAGRNSTNALNLLLMHDSSIYSKTSRGLRPLHWAVKKEAEEAAQLLAFIEVSDELDNEDIKIASFEPEIASLDDIVDTDDNNIRVPVPAMTPIIHKGHSFSVPLGSGQELSFIWLESLKLWFGKYEVSNGQFRRYKHAHTSMFAESISLDHDDQPAVFVTWNDAKEFCNWLNLNYANTIPEGWLFRLPTSEEWMNAALCGTERKYPWGSNWPPLYGNYSDLSAKKTFSEWQGIANYDDGFPATAPVTQSGTNEWGLCGLGGNVWEWCEDWYGKDKQYKVRHGGGWDFDVKASLSINYRGFDRPSTKQDTIGFRVIIAKRSE